jgi:hypothetical protein
MMRLSTLTICSAAVAALNSQSVLECTALQVDDAAGYIALTGALDTLGATPLQQRTLFKLLAACLHLGNISFALDDSDPAATATAAAAANISPQRLSFLRGSSGSGSAFFSGNSSGNATTITTASNSTGTSPAGVSFGVVSGGSHGGNTGGVSPLGGSSGTTTSMHRKFSFSGMLARRSKSDASSSSTTAAANGATAATTAAVGPPVIVNSRGPLELAASLLGVKAAELEKVLLSPGAGGDVRAAVR